MGRGSSARPSGPSATQLAHESLKVRRRKERFKKGTLKGTLVQPYTLIRYRRAVSWFFQWMNSEGIPVPIKTGDFDAVVMEAIEFAWSEGEPRGLVGNMLSGLEYEVDGLRTNLRGSWKLWKHWGTQELPNRVPPLSLEATMCIASFLWKWQHQEAALSVLLAFHRFLRTAEFMKAKVGHYLLPRGGTEGHLLLAGTKTAQNDSISFSDPLLVQVLQKLCLGRKTNDLFIRMPPHRFREVFKKAVVACGLPETFKPYSLRRGGASHYFRLTGNMARAMEIGRWRDVRTARIYINTALLGFAESTHLASPWLACQTRRFHQELETFVR